MPRENSINEEQDGRCRAHPDIAFAFQLPAGICPRRITGGDAVTRRNGIAPTDVGKS
jgi:hypothetical protein